MILKNLDMVKLFEILYTYNLRAFSNEDREICIQNYNGQKLNPSYFGSSGNYTFTRFVNVGREGNSNSTYDGLFIWVGGDINSIPANYRTGIDREKVRYEDYDLYAPFTGGISPNSGNIYGQEHIVSSAAEYNSEKDQWEKTATREFKNESGKTITIRELGVYKNIGGRIFLISRELLETPIEVADDSYFKVSWTYKVENPHENRELKRIRQYSLPTEFGYYIEEEAPYSFSPTINGEKKRLLLIRNFDIYNKNQITEELLENYYKNLSYTLEGWTIEKHLGHFSLYNKAVNEYNEQTIITMDILSPDLTDKNLISSPGYGTSIAYSGRYSVFNIIFLENSILDLNWEKNNENFYQLDDSSNDCEVINNSEHQSLWISCTSPRVTLNGGTVQKDYNFCDNLWYYQCHGNVFLFDITNNKHIFKLPYNSNYEGGAIIRLDITMDVDENEEEIPVYEDIPVQR